MTSSIETHHAREDNATHVTHATHSTCAIRAMREPYIAALQYATRSLRPRRRMRWRWLWRWWSMLATLIVVVASMAGVARADDIDADDDDCDVRRGNVDLTAGATADVMAGASRVRIVPSVAEVLEAAYVAAGLDRDPTPSWRRRARVAGLIPWMTVKVGWDQNWRDDEPDVGRSRDFEVRATWRLDRLLFDGRELQMATIDTARRRERRRLARTVIRAYFVWRKAAAAIARGELGRGELGRGELGRSELGRGDIGRSDIGGDLLGGSPAEQAAAAELDALTDGWFSERTNSPR